MTLHLINYIIIIDIYVQALLAIFAGELRPVLKRLQIILRVTRSAVPFT